MDAQSLGGFKKNRWQSASFAQGDSMEQGSPEFTAVFLKADHGYVGFVEELPGVNAQGKTLDEARERLQKLAVVIFDEERRGAEEFLAGKDAVRETFSMPLPPPPCR
jgi:predicted RNase H-like HicB family nuclease